MGLPEKLAQGIAAAQAGRRAEARRLLTEVAQADEKQLEAWQWLCRVVDSLEDKQVCLENVLALDPTNEAAQARLAEIQAQHEQLFAPVYAPGQEEPPPQVVQPVEPFEPPTAMYPHQDEFDNPWLCPYCLAPTQPVDKACPACHHALILRRRVKEERTVWLWRGFFVQLTLAFGLTVLGTGFYILIAKLSGISNPLALLPVYFWQKVDQSPAVIESILTVFPRWAFWGLLAFVVYSLLLLMMLYFRMPNGHVVYLINSGAMLAAGLVLAVIFYYSVPIIAACVVMLLVGGMQLWVTLNLWYDFTFEQTRLRLTFDQGVKGHTSLFISGRRYSELGMWGRAALHLRRAISVEPSQPTYHIALVVAYINLKRYDLARDALARAEQLAPNSPEIQRLKQELATRLKPVTTP
jgi:tetratricopeptide (TPR) repeat protein